jgi:hypothetical protein
MSKYPEHEKLSKVSDKSTACGQFVEWLAEKGILLARRHEHTPECYEDHRCGRDCAYDACGRQPGGSRDTKIRTCGMLTEHPALYRIYEPLTKLLAEFFDIDEKKIEVEKRAMLDDLRRRVSP